MKKSVKIFTLLLTAVLLTALTGCFNLGSFGESDEERDRSIKEIDYLDYYKPYYDSVGDIHLYKQDKSESTFGLSESFFNKETVQDMKVNIDPDPYILMSFEMNKSLVINEISMYVKAAEGEVDTLLDVMLYVTDSPEFSDLPAYDDNPDDLYKKDKAGEYLYDLEDKKVFKDFDLPDKRKAVSGDSLTVASNYWSSFRIKSFSGSKTLSVEKGKSIVICFYNNTGYQRGNNLDETDEANKRYKVSLLMTNLLICSK